MTRRPDPSDRYQPGALGAILRDPTRGMVEGRLHVGICDEGYREIVARGELHVWSARDEVDLRRRIERLVRG